MAPTPPPATDKPSSARQPRVDITSAWCFAAALVVYIALGLWLKRAVLNWIVGPLFMVIVLYVIPTALRHLVRAMRGDRAVNR